MARHLTSDELYRIACEAGERLGVEVVADLGAGADGVVYMLEDGGCLKLTVSASEAIVAALAIERAARGEPGLPAVPAFRAVAAVDGVEDARLFAVIREGVECPFPDPDDRELAEERVLKSCLRYVDHAWELGLDRPENRYLYAVARAEWGDRALDLGQVVDGLRTLRDELGVSVHDLHYDNFGVTDSGRLCIRDFSRCEMDMPTFLARRDALPRIEVDMSAAPAP